MKQVQKRTALKLWSQGKEVYMLPCKVCLENLRIQPYLMPTVEKMKKETFKTRVDENRKVICENVTDPKELFNKVYNNFLNYNCNNEMGTYIHFYIN